MNGRNIERLDDFGRTKQQVKFSDKAQRPNNFPASDFRYSVCGLITSKCECDDRVFKNTLILKYIDDGFRGAICVHDVFEKKVNRSASNIVTIAISIACRFQAFVEHVIRALQPGPIGISSPVGVDLILHD